MLLVGLAIVSKPYRLARVLGYAGPLTTVLDVVDPKQKAAIWRGIAETEARRDFTPDQRRVRIEKAVHEILKKLPKK